MHYIYAVHSSLWAHGFNYEELTNSSGLIQDASLGEMKKNQNSQSHQVSYWFIYTQSRFQHTIVDIISIIQRT